MADQYPNSTTSQGAHDRHREDPVLNERRSLRDYLIILRERMWIALPIALLCALSLAYVQTRETKLYQSRATMRFEKQDRIVTTQSVTSAAVESEIDINTNLQTLRSNRLRDQVARSFSADELQILQQPYLASLPPGIAPPSAGGCLGLVDVSSVPNSLIIAVTVSHQSAEAAKIIADRYVQQFLRYLVEEVGGKNEYAVEILQKRAEQLRAESEQASARLQQYMQQQKMVSFDETSNLVSARLQAVEAELTRSHLARLELEGQYSQIKTFEKDSKNLLQIAFIASYGQVPALKAQLTALEREQAVLSERYLERHPKVIEVANSLTVVREQLDSAIKLAIDDMRTRLEKTVLSIADLQKEKELREKEIFQLRDLRGEYESLKSQADVKTKNYIEVLDRLNQARTTSGIDKIPIFILDHAEVAGAPFTPNYSSITRTAVMVFLVVYLLVAIGLSLIDDRVKSSWDIEHFIGAPLLGIIPELDQSTKEDHHRLVVNQNHGSGTQGLEAFLGVYSSVKIHSKLDFPKSILVTSTVPGEGKTLVSSNLAGSFARHGRKTLLIDCDLRRPMLHHHFKQTNKQGILAWHEAGADLESNLMGNPSLGILHVGENLWLLCSGGHCKTPTNILESRVFSQLLDRLKHEFELIVVDSPPLGAVTDSLLLAEQTDEVLFVCRFNRAQRKHIKMYINALRQGKHELLGVVLNGLSPRRIEYYSNYRHYRSYKKYYGSAQS